MVKVRSVLFLVNVAAFIISTVSAAPSAEITLKNLPSFECLASYAKLQQIKDIPEVFDKAADFDSSNAECVANRQNLISIIRTEIRSKINEVEILPKYSNCIYDKLTGSESFVHSVVKAAALEHLQNNKDFSPLNATIKRILDDINSSVAFCRQMDEFGIEFDKLFNATKNLTAREEYCIKKYLVKNNLIDIYLYDIDPNPHKVNVTGLSCEEMIRKSNEEVYDQLSFIYLPNLSTSDEKVECAIEKFREAEYFDLMMKITALTTLNITLEQKSQERENFIKIFTNISSNIATC